MIALSKQDTIIRGEEVSVSAAGEALRNNTDPDFAKLVRDDVEQSLRYLGAACELYECDSVDALIEKLEFDSSELWNNTHETH